MVTLAQTIRVLSNGKYTVGPEGTISSSDLSLIEDLVSAEVARKNPGFTGSDLVRFTAYHVLDILSNSTGSGQIVEKTVKDTRWKVSSSASSSQWMDYADRMVDEFKKAKTFSAVPTGVSRCDYDMKGFDNSTIKQWGDPSASI